MRNRGEGRAAQAGTFVHDQITSIREGPKGQLRYAIEGVALRTDRPGFNIHAEFGERAGDDRAETRSNAANSQNHGAARMKLGNQMLRGGEVRFRKQTVERVPLGRAKLDAFRQRRATKPIESRSN